MLLCEVFFFHLRNINLEKPAWREILDFRGYCSSYGNAEKCERVSFIHVITIRKSVAIRKRQEFIGNFPGNKFDENLKSFIEKNYQQ